MGPGLWAQSEPYHPFPYQEQLYLQLNQELFLSGDTLWAGVVVLESETLTRSQLSKVAYLEIWGEGSAVIKQRVILDQATSMVAVPLPPDLRSGKYMVRAYTRWMRNGPENMFFRHWIRVVNPQSPPPVKEADQELYPLMAEIALEGGQLIENQQHFLHIRATSWDGTPTATNGFLIAGLRDTIREFQVPEGGGTKLEFTAQPSTDYRVIVRTTKEEYQSIPVGTASSTGMGMRMVVEAGEAHLHIVGGEEQLRYNATLAIVQRGNVRVLPEMSFRSDEGRKIRLNELSLKPGVAQFILRDGEGKPVGSCAWVEEAKVQMPVDSEENSSVSTMITTRKMGEHPVGLADYTQLVAGLTSFVPSHRDQLYRPEEWLPFEGDPETATRWESGEPLIKAEVSGIILEGTVKDASGNPVPDERVYLAFPGDVAWLHLAVTDSNGCFHFVLEPNLGQPKSTIIRGGKTFDPSWTISLNSGFAEPLEQETWPSLTIDQTTWDQLQAYYQVQQLAEKYIDPTYESQTQSGISPTTPIYGAPNFTYQFSDYTTMPTEEAFIEFISQAYVRKPNKVKTIYLLNTDRQELFPGPPLLLVDGIPVVGSSDIFSINYRLVERIELVTQPYVLNGTFINGVLNLITFQKDASSVALRKGELRAELLIVPPAASSGNQILQGSHVPDFSQMNEIRLETSAVSTPASDFSGNIWIQSVGR